MGDKSWVIRDLTVYGEDRIYERASVQIKDGKIQGLQTRYEAGESEEREEAVSFDSDYICVPGFIDVHIHGAAGADTMDGTPEALSTIAEALSAEGTTSFLATTMTQESGRIDKALANAGDYFGSQSAGGRAEMLGVHLEGPFISPKRAGAQPVEHIIDPDTDLFVKWQELAGGHIRLVTLAPEQNGGLDLVRYLAEQGVVASVGHSDATFGQMEEAIEAGASHVTHLYNGMRGLHHREPGVVGAAFLRKELTAEMIVDGIHMRPEMVELAFREKKKSGLVLITDAIRAKCLRNGTYDLGGQDAIVKDGEARLANGSLAGSMLKMKDAVQNVMAYTGCNLGEALQMSAANPARELNVFDRKGSIAAGKDADLVVLDRDLNVVMTVCRGEIAYEREGERR